MPDVRSFPAAEDLATSLSGILRASSGAITTATAGTHYSAPGHTHTASEVTDFHNAVRTNRLDQMTTPTAAVGFGSQRLTDLSEPSAAQDAATKAYVDSVSTGLDIKASVRAASTANVALTGGATLTIDGVALANGNRVLLKDQSTGGQNGIYTVAGIGTAYTLTRATDADANAEVTSGLFTFVTEGTANGNKGFVLTTDDPITVGSTSLTFAQFSASSGVSIGDSITSATAGSILYAGTSGVLAQDNANLFYDATNLRVGIGTASPSRGVHVKSAAANGVGAAVRLDSTASGGAFWEFISTGSALSALNSLYEGDAAGAARIVTANGEHIFGRAIQDSAVRGQVTVYSRTAGTVGIVVVQAGSATADPFQIRANDGTTVLSSFGPLGAWKPPSMADASAPNNSVYYSTTASKLVYKDSGGVVNNLY